MIVPTLNSLCGVPMRVAAATSVLMFGVTTIPGILASWAHSLLMEFHFAAMASIGAMMGFQIGLWVSKYTSRQMAEGRLAVGLALVAIQIILFLR